MNGSAERFAHTESTQSYDEYILSPYRSSSAQCCRARTSSGLLPRGPDPASSLFRFECIVLADAYCTLAARVGFLHRLVRLIGDAPPSIEAIERHIDVDERPLEDFDSRVHVPFDFPSTLEIDGIVERFQYAIEGVVELSAIRLASRVFRVIAQVENQTASDRNGFELRSLFSTHINLRVVGGEFISLTDPTPTPKHSLSVYQIEKV